jgi:hypothetical protein
MVQSARIHSCRALSLGARSPSPDLISSRSLSNEHIEVCRVHVARVFALECDIGLSGLVSWIVVGTSGGRFQIRQPRRLRSIDHSCNLDRTETADQKKAQLTFAPTTQHCPCVERLHVHLSLRQRSCKILSMPGEVTLRVAS